MLETSTDSKEGVRALQRKLYQKAKQQTAFRFYALYDKVYRRDVLQHAYELVKQNKGSPGIDGITFETIEREKGKQEYLLALQETLKGNTYPSKLEMDLPLTDLGLDSLMAMELIVRIETDLQITVPVVRFLGGPSIDQMVPWLLEEIKNQEDDDEEEQDEDAPFVKGNGSQATQ